ncbi:MAG TPA: hypothetical protein PKE21_10160 [Flavobacteriales bacterium]|nr:hypothetical protein [Flavobacteriales bacterium]HMR27830.1 hypothetical protein [Flavobacteriales bacterium]
MRRVAEHGLLIGALVIFGVPLIAQPQPPDFCFVISEPGDADKPLSRAYVVKQQYRERVPYYNSDQQWLKPDTTITLQSRELFKERNDGWRVFTPVVGVSESRILVIAGGDTMRIDLPDDMRPLIDRAWTRWPEPSPDVMRFKPGRRWDVNTCINEVQAGVATHQFILNRLKQEANWVEPPAQIPPPGIRPPEPRRPIEPIAIPEPERPATPKEWEAFWAEQPPLKKVEVERTNADTVWLRISGRVMLNGGCGSGMPLFNIEMRTDTGWVDRIHFEWIQMDCGMPWGDWEGHVVMLPPLRWWVGANSPAATKELMPGTYRIVLKGGNMQEVRSPSFKLR